MKCPNCGSDNKENSKFCFKCGFKLLQQAPQVPPQQIPVMEQPKAVPQPAPVIPHMTLETAPVSLPDSQRQDLSTRPLVCATLTFKDSCKEISLPFKPVVYIGRADKQSGINPEIDLTEVDTGKTTSRKHGYIVLTNGKYKIADTGSMNGTFLNGVKLDKDVEYELKNGDEIVFGKLGCLFNSTV